MEIFRHIENHQLPLAGCVTTMGNFDGIHLGHQALIRSAVGDAREFGSRSVVLTFEPHPLRVLAPTRAPRLILSHKDKMELLQAFGVDAVIIQRFDAPFAELSAQEFTARVLADGLKTRKIWVGKDLRFGQGRKGGVEDLARWGPGFGFQVGVVEPVMVDGVRVSSSHVRQLVEEGQVEKAMTLLGRYHFVSGKVVGGHRRGRDLGFPTANIDTRTEVLPADGIYATLFQLGEKKMLSVSSVGLNPTFGAGPRSVESFILNFDGEIYGQSVKLLFVKRIREERKFESVQPLITQMYEDVVSARAIFHELGFTTAT